MDSEIHDSFSDSGSSPSHHEGAPSAAYRHARRERRAGLNLARRIGAGLVEMRNRLLVSVLVAAGLFVAGCAAEEQRTTPGPAWAADLKLCGGCGQIKGSALCCKPGATLCPA